MKKWLAIIAITSSSFYFTACGAGQGGGGFNLFSPEQDIELGKQTEQEIAQHPDQYPVLPEKAMKKRIATFAILRLNCSIPEK